MEYTAEHSKLRELFSFQHRWPTDELQHFAKPSETDLGYKIVLVVLLSGTALIENVGFEEAMLGVINIFFRLSVNLHIVDNFVCFRT